MRKQFLMRLFITVFFVFGSVTSVANQGELTAEKLKEKSSKVIKDIETFELQDWLSRHPETVLIDVRSRDELVKLGGMIDGQNSFNVMRGWLEFQISTIVSDKSTPIVVYCGINERSPLAALTLHHMGYTNVMNYSDGFFVWRDAGLPVYSYDKNLDSFLYNQPVQVADNVWTVIGATQPRTYENSGHNNNLSFVITTDGVLVVNAGDNYLLAKALHKVSHNGFCR